MAHQSHHARLPTSHLLREHSAGHCHRLRSDESSMPLNEQSIRGLVTQGLPRLAPTVRGFDDCLRHLVSDSDIFYGIHEQPTLPISALTAPLGVYSAHMWDGVKTGSPRRHVAALALPLDPASQSRCVTHSIIIDDSELRDDSDTSTPVLGYSAELHRYPEAVLSRQGFCVLQLLQKV